MPWFRRLRARAGYSFDVYDITCLPDIPTSGAEVLELGDDDNVPIDISAAPFTFYGVSYDKMYVGSNGYVTFDAGDDYWYDNRFQHFEQPRISILMDDLNPVPEWGGGGAFFYQARAVACRVLSHLPQWVASRSCRGQPV